MQDFYTKWMFELHRECFEDTKVYAVSNGDMSKKRLEV
jgi:hypothetical protein